MGSALLRLLGIAGSKTLPSWIASTCAGRYPMRALYSQKVFCSNGNGGSPLWSRSGSHLPRYASRCRVASQAPRSREESLARPTMVSSSIRSSQHTLRVRTLHHHHAPLPLRFFVLLFLLTLQTLLPFSPRRRPSSR